MKLKGVVVDLDGTFLTTNTFERYYFFLFRLSLIRLRIKNAVYLGFLLLIRKFRIISHSSFKRKVLGVSNKFVRRRDIQMFVDNVMVHTNKRVVSLYQNYKLKGYYTCMATAAPAHYAKLIGTYFGFDAVCATDSAISNIDEWKENIRENKLSFVKDFLTNKGVSINVVITDHHDDFPLMEKSLESNYLVDPSVETINFLANRQVKYSLV
ncbi:HAD family hydrolase [Alkalitalea saponilacus]|uniref:Haloacid dehalogenase-like hydrolase n=1 Tax=Alkalitalea saponilacus TaxID=889453 RepID=A0A1T5FKI7_9BACT|nr:HAD family hydrolase [Alkalitalea saponilacus]ASB49427.1 hypothetical protein CDL62_09900 [Alkalitalea saponilacus]SKB96597.1 haloacid dehalogenase-like hydrolase [Alkalitalea saponilacus]